MNLIYENYKPTLHVACVVSDIYDLTIYTYFDARSQKKQVVMGIFQSNVDNEMINEVCELKSRL